MQYNVGMYGGSFSPLHRGHINCMLKGASMCEELYIVISWSLTRDAISKSLRYRWILEVTRHLPNVHIILIEDKAIDKEHYNDVYWEKGAQDIKNAIGKPIDVVFCGSDYKGTKRFEKLYHESEVIYFERSEIPISSTDIRKWAHKYWDYIPNVCRPFYTKKVLILGGESTGKSTLVESLAIMYNTNFVNEVGRDICDKAGCEELMIMDDFEEILLRHKVNMLDAIKNSNKLIFVDTDSITTKFYAQFLLDNEEEIYRINHLADAITNLNEFDLILFLEPSVNFIQDGTRSEVIRADREKYSQEIKKLLEFHNIEYHCIAGDYLDRLNKSRDLITKILSYN